MDPRYSKTTRGFVKTKAFSGIRWCALTRDCDSRSVLADLYSWKRINLGRHLLFGEVMMAVEVHGVIVVAGSSR